MINLCVENVSQYILRPQDELHETVSDVNWNLEVHKNQCFMNDQLVCGKFQPLNAEGTG